MQYDLLIFSGQSNMQGQCEKLADREPLEMALEYRYLQNRFQLLRDPVGEDIRYDGSAGLHITKNVKISSWLPDHVTGSPVFGHSTLVPPFCRVYTEETECRAVAVSVAKGSTQLKDWLPGTPAYEFLCKKVDAARAALQKQGDIRHVYFIWLQGESDALAQVTKEEYMDQLARFNESLRSDLRVEKFGIIRVGRFAGPEKDGPIMDAQDAICEENSGFLMLSTMAADLYDQPECMNSNANGHFSAKGLQLLGEDAGHALGKYAKRNS